MSDSITIQGHASVFGVKYDVGPYAEVIERGAFRQSLNNTALDVPLLLNHEGLPLARTTSGTLHLSEDDHGLAVRAELDGDDPDVQRLRPKMARGDVNEMSFAFRCLDDSWEDRGKLRRVRAAELHRGDVSIVRHGASPTTRIGLRAFEGLDLEQRKELVGQTLEFRGSITAVDGRQVAARPAPSGRDADLDLRVARARGTSLDTEVELLRRGGHRIRPVTARDRAELGWQSRHQATEHLSEAQIMRSLLGKSHAEQDRALAALRRRAR